MGDGDDSERDQPRLPDALLAAVGERIRTVREAKGFGLTEAAQAAGMNKGHLWRMEAGQQNPTVKMLARVAAALATTPSDLLEGVGDEPTRDHRASASMV